MWACCSFPISILLIRSIACTTLRDFTGSGSCKSVPKISEITCQVTPNLSVTQLHCSFVPPCASFSHKMSTSSCVVQLAKKDMAGEKV